MSGPDTETPRRSAPRPNRGTPAGDVVAIPLRGAWMGNRGHIHDGTEIVRRFRGRGWVICELDHKGWRQPQWHPRFTTILFFHDEAVALAAGHRPCALCRRQSYRRYRAGWAAAQHEDPPAAAEMDRQLHAERVDPRTGGQSTHRIGWPDLPAGAFVLFDDAPALVRTDTLIRWSGAGYGRVTARPAAGDATVLTPPWSVAALQGGYLPQIDVVALDR